MKRRYDRVKILVCNTFDDAIVAYVVQKWREVGNTHFGRTMVQKVCYFLKAKGIPLEYDFDMYHYGPYSQELYYRVDELMADGIINDESNTKNKSQYLPGQNNSELVDCYLEELSTWIPVLNQVINSFSNASPSDMELLATTHYFENTMHKYYKRTPDTKELVEKVYEVKNGKFDRDKVLRAYEQLKEIGLVS